MNTVVPLDEQQHVELRSIVSIIEDEHHDELEKLFHEGKLHVYRICSIITEFYFLGDKCGVGQKLRNAWNMDERREYSEFMNDQEINSELVWLFFQPINVKFNVEIGKKVNRWSVITVRMGMIAILISYIIVHKYYSPGCIL